MTAPTVVVVAGESQKSDEPLQHPPADAPATPDTTTALATGVAIGEKIGAAEAAASDAAIRGREWERRATTAEAECESLKAEAANLRLRIVELTPPPEAATETIAVATENLTPPPATDQTPAPLKSRGLLAKLFLGE